MKSVLPLAAVTALMLVTHASAQQVKSRDGGMAVVVKFVNVSQFPADVFWADFDGNETFYLTLNPGDEHDQDTTSGHAWVFRTAGRKLGEYVASPVLQQRFEIGGRPIPRMAVTSSTFVAGGAIPKRCAAAPEGENVVPNLKFVSVPADAVDMAISCVADDGTVHWLMYNIQPRIGRVDEGQPFGGTPGRNDFGQDTYTGPQPAAGQTRRYVFTLYALAAPLALPNSADKTTFDNALQGKIISEATITGTYKLTAAAGQPVAGARPVGGAQPVGAQPGGMPGRPGVGAPAAPGIAINIGPGGVRLGPAVAPGARPAVVPVIVGGAGAAPAFAAGAQPIVVEPIPGVGPVGPAVRVQTGFQFTEGPAADRAGNLFFTDVQGNRIYKLDAAGRINVFVEPSNYCNGLMVNAGGEIVACQMAGRLIALAPDGKSFRVLTENYNGNRYNAPNDLVIDREGGVYFTDPHFRAPQPLPQGTTAVYYVRRTGEVTRLLDDLAAPNGVILSPDEKTLYVIPSQSAEMMAYPVEAPGRLGAGRVFCTLRQAPGETSRGGDGLTVDTAGNVYITSDLGIQVFSAAGRLVGVLALPEKPANCTFGGPGNKTLFVTARTSLYALPMNATGHTFAQPAR